jgi:site-specific recombinase XerD
LPDNTALPFGDFEAALRQSGRSEHGVQGALTDARQLREFAGGRPLESLQQADVLEFLGWLESDRGQKPSSMKRKLASVRLLFEYYRREKRVQDNPTDGVGIAAPATQRPLPLTPGQSRRLVAAATSDLRWHTLMLLMLTTGLKREEVIQLRWSDISRNFETGATRVTVRGRFPAAANARTLSLPRITANALQRLANTLPDGARSAGSVLGLSARGLGYAVTQCAERAGLGHLDVTPQRLRDTFAVGFLAGLEKRQRAEASGLSARGQADLRRGYEQGFLRILGVGRNRALINYYRAALVESEDADGSEGIFLRDRDFASADEL